MKRLKLIPAMLSLILLAGCRQSVESVDICIYGGTSAGADNVVAADAVLFLPVKK